MRAAIALLVDHEIHNLMRKLAVDIHREYQTGFLAATLPPHVSLKQPFQISNLDGLVAYFDGLAQSVEPFEITFTGVEVTSTSSDSDEYGILWLGVQDKPGLRELHNRINRELSERFKDTEAAFDGSAYRFHASIVISQQCAPGQHAEVYQCIQEMYGGLGAGLTFMAREMALFYYDDRPELGSFVTYRILPLGQTTMAQGR
jgi:2'-5' RNA ligase